MASVVFYFQVHQPFRLRKYSVFDEEPLYFADDENKKILLKVADKCYRPATTLIRDLVKMHEGRFKVSYAITGVALEQLQAWAPDVIDLFKELADTGCCEFIGETFYHSLSFLYSREEFRRQVDEHEAIVQDLFGQTPRVFRNTELIFNNDLAREVGSMRRADGSPRYLGMCCEGVDWLLNGRSPAYVYNTPGGVVGREEPFGLLLKNHRLSDDIAFRFGNQGWPEWPLSAEKFARWVVMAASVHPRFRFVRNEVVHWSPPKKNSARFSHWWSALAKGNYALARLPACSGTALPTAAC